MSDVGILIVCLLAAGGVAYFIGLMHLDGEPDWLSPGLMISGALSFVAGIVTALAVAVFG